MTSELIVICLYLFFGVCFGFVTYPYRHFFSEGPEKSKNSDQASPLEGRVFWVLICTWLWPIMVITGLNTAWILSKRKKQAQKNSNSV
jgi:ATP/ADP translocase